ncbi:hypothetical protein, partial [Colwellia sp. BRX10-4]|uniref:hypothetical protein n=1 Tax=Colwellia sp. BRX10-4 TaxID=2759843 RepID=UPI001C71314A
LNLFQYLVFVEQVQILKQVQDDGVVFRITESVLFIIRIFSLSCRHAEFISVSGLRALSCRHAEFISVSGFCRASTDPETSSG